MIQKLIELWRAFHHVRTGGKTTRTRARARAARPKRCPTCRQQVKASTDYRDYLCGHNHDWRRA